MTSPLEKLAQDESGRAGYVLLWLLGVPLPVLVLLYLFSH